MVREQIRGVASDIVGRGRENRKKVTELVAREIRRQVGRIGFATKDDVERLRQRVQALEVAQRRGKGAKAAPAPAKRKPASRARTTRKRPTARR